MKCSKKDASSVKSTSETESPSLEYKKTIKEQSDIELMLRVKADDTDAFSEIVNRYQNRLQKFFLKSFRLSDAEDLCQEVILGLWNGRKQYKPIADFHVYLYAIAKRIRALRIRTMKHDLPSLTLKQSQDSEDSPQLYLNINIRDKQRRPDEEFLAKESHERLKEAINSLPAEQREVMNLILYKGLSEEEIAKELGCSRGTVSSRRNRAKAKLRQRLTNT
ncbi:RNA polymerase sigma-H factor [subsurface metagenome]